jgi:hypothetical protein
MERGRLDNREVYIVGRGGRGHTRIALEVTLLRGGEQKSHFWSLLRLLFLALRHPSFFVWVLVRAGRGIGCFVDYFGELNTWMFKCGI